MSSLPWTPDFDHYSIEFPIKRATAHGSYVQIIWADGKESQYDVYLLRENSPDPETVHPRSREMLISPLDLPFTIWHLPLSYSVGSVAQEPYLVSRRSHLVSLAALWLRVHSLGEFLGLQLLLRGER